MSEQELTLTREQQLELQRTHPAWTQPTGEMFPVGFNQEPPVHEGVNMNREKECWKKTPS